MPRGYRRPAAELRWPLKRALSDPRILSGIGDAHSDEILHAARLSPFKRTGDLDAEETARRFEAARHAAASSWPTASSPAS